MNYSARPKKRPALPKKAAQKLISPVGALINVESERIRGGLKSAFPTEAHPRPSRMALARTWIDGSVLIRKRSGKLEEGIFLMTY